jgi:hypothetical protein
MILTPFKIVYELFVFGLQAAFLYGLALIIAIGCIAYAIAQHPKERLVAKPKIEEKLITKKECTRPAGCRVLKDGTVEW